MRMPTFARLCAYWYCPGPDERHSADAVTSFMQAGSAPDVWLQLLERCAAEPGCQPAALRSLAQQLAEHRVLTAQQAQLCGVQQRQISSLLQQIGGLQWCVNAQQQQGYLQQQQLSAQQQQIAGLQEQLREVLQHIKQVETPAQRYKGHY